LVSSFISLGSQFTVILGMLALMFWLDWKLALVGVAVIPFFLLAAFRFSWRIRKSAREQREKYGKMVATVQESFAGIAQIKGFGREKQREKLIGKAMARDVKANLKTTRLAANYSRIVELITAAGIGLALWVGVNRALDGAITAGDLIIFLAYLRGVYRPLRGVAKTTTRLAKASSRAEKILELLALEPEVKDKDDSVSAKSVHGTIKFKDVTFSYSGANIILNKFSCHMPVGKTTLIIGRTGAGKSTIAKLLLRLYEPSAGVISIDGRDITQFRINSLRKKMTPLTQETFLFRTTIRDNIAFGKRRTTDKEIESASRKVGADKFIRSMPDGYETLVGEGGATLSGGQRQLISFARAALRNTSIMIFDEPATGLDIHAEREARNALKSLKPDGVLIIISHRLAFLEMADWVVFVQNGQLIEEGEPNSLLESHGPLYQYVNTDDESYQLSKKVTHRENVSE
ncbi:MAG: ABC transporter ATP-binding protein, partial [candidate division Zixibacteria bacterium]|nr:ABC transporter ATP-binding protein [candidate division Zixibacteria bacterium]